MMQFVVNIDQPQSLVSMLKLLPKGRKGNQGSWMFSTFLDFFYHCAVGIAFVCWLFLFHICCICFECLIVGFFILFCLIMKPIPKKK